MKKYFAAINLILADMMKRLEQIESKLSEISNVTSSNTDTEFLAITENLPVKDEKGLRNLEDKLQNKTTFNAMVSDVRIIINELLRVI